MNVKEIPIQRSQIGINLQKISRDWLGGKYANGNN